MNQVYKGVRITNKQYVNTYTYMYTYAYSGQLHTGSGSESCCRG